MDGYFIIDKPAGMTSHDVVAAIRRAFGEKRVGHAGTLDPAATGVLPILVGRATKLSEHLSGSDKVYAGTIRFGVTTDTDDTDGTVIASGDASTLDFAAIEASAAAYTGCLAQVPPAFSAVKIGGEAMYKSARRGAPVKEAPSRGVTITSFVISDFRPGTIAEADFTVACSKGTYIRSLARDLGKAVGTGACISSLRRLSHGTFTIEDSADLEEVLAKGPAPYLKRITSAVSRLPNVTVDAKTAADVMNGKGIALPPGLEGVPAGSRIALIDEEGFLLALHAKQTSGLTKPERTIGEGRL
jgi:tRNA pseudouridine55 synthase